MRDTAADLAETPPLEVTVQAGHIHVLAQGVRRVRAELQQVREEVGLIDAHNLHAFVQCV
jgi:hypothetical protein